MRRDLRLIVLIREDLKVLPFADVISKAALSPQLFKDPECWSGRSRTHGLPHGSPVLNQLSHREPLMGDSTSCSGSIAKRIAERNRRVRGSKPAQACLVEHPAVTREVAGSNPGRINTQDLKMSEVKCCLCNFICKWLDFPVFSHKDYKPWAPFHKYLSCS